MEQFFGQIYDHAIIGAKASCLRGSRQSPVAGTTSSTSHPLADLRAVGGLVWIYCNDCCLEREVEPTTIALPSNSPVPEVERRLKCKACGGKVSVP